jgi:glutaminase
VSVVGTSGIAFAAGDADYEFSIQRVSKPFVFALICQFIGEDEAREELGVNSTGLPINSVVGIEQSSDGTTNPMVNAGAIAAGGRRAVTTQADFLYCSVPKLTRILATNPRFISIRHSFAAASRLTPVIRTQ